MPTFLGLLVDLGLWRAQSDMRKHRKCLRTRIDDGKMSTFSHVMLMIVYTVGATMYWYVVDKKSTVVLSV